jgi:hypothetical protein
MIMHQVETSEAEIKLLRENLGEASVCKKNQRKIVYGHVELVDTTCDMTAGSRVIVGF